MKEKGCSVEKTQLLIVRVSNKLMAFRVRKFHSLLLGLIGLCLIAYSSYFSSPGLLFLESTVADVDVASDQNSLPPSNEVLQTQRNFINGDILKVDFRRVLGNDGADTTKTHSTVVTAAKEKNNMPVQDAHEEVQQHVVLPTTAVQAIEGAVGPENITVNATGRQALAQNIAQVPSSAQGGSQGGAAVAPNTAVIADTVGKAILTQRIYEHDFHVPSTDLCPNMGEKIKLLIIVTSAPAHKEARMAIRYTWGNFRQKKDVSIGFLVGSVSDSQKQQLLDLEMDTYNDVIQSKFLDSYNNLTLKTISLLEWVDTYCSKAKFVLKTDDDMFINVPRLLAFLEKHNSDKKTIFGRLAKKWKPIRNKASKYYVSLDQYKPPIFPDFTTGPAYLITSDIIHDMYITALNKTYLKLEDVFLTGIVAQEMKVKRIHVSEFLNKRISLNACSIQKGISIHMIKYPEQFDLWKKLLDGKSKCS